LEKRNIGTRFTTEKKISQILPTPKDKLPLFQLFQFDLEKTVVLAKTTKYHQRLIREAIEIRKYPNNFKRDTE
jgi:hypothetical protein